MMRHGIIRLFLICACLPLPYKAVFGNESKQTTEVKIEIQNRAIEKAKEKLGLSDKMSQSGQVFFLDTPDLQFHSRGMIIRIRLWDTLLKGEVTVKNRPAVLSKIPADIRSSPNFKFEPDFTNEVLVPSATFTKEKDKGELISLLMQIAAGTPIDELLNKLLSKKQKQMVDLKIPPSLWSKARVTPTVRFVLWPNVSLDKNQWKVELWTNVKDQRIMEVSRRVSANQAPQAVRDCKKQLAALQIKTARHSRLKTEFALGLKNP